MRLRNLLLLVLAVLLAGGTAMLARSYLAAQRASQVVRVAPPPPKPERSVLVASANMSRGQIVKAQDLRWQLWPDNAITPGYIVSGGKETPQSFAGWVSLDTVAAGAPITQKMFISPGSGGFLAAVLKPGMRAIQVQRVQLPDGTSPGDRVDMMVRFKLPAAIDRPLRSDDAELDRPVAQPQSRWPARMNGWNGDWGVETVMRGLRILKIVGWQLESGKARSRPQGSTPVIFEVTPKQAEMIAIAEQMGPFTFTLDSLRQEPHEIAANARGVTLAAAHDPADPAAAAAATVLRPAGAEQIDPPDDAGPTYTSEAEVNPILAVPARDINIKGAVTVLRGNTLDKPAEIPVVLRCTENACVTADPLPTKLVGPEQPADGK